MPPVMTYTARMRVMTTRARWKSMASETSIIRQMPMSTAAA
jgi:hypothetical protein